MLVISSRIAVAMLIACTTACGSLADVAHDHADDDAVASAVAVGLPASGGAPAFTGILLCEIDEGSYGVPLTYAAIDADGDGFTVPASGEVCVNGTLPPPYQAAEHGHDCDDADPMVAHLVLLYPDQDGDGVGATPRQSLCIGSLPPPGLTRGGYDEDDGDPTVIETDEEEELLVLDI